MKRVMMWAMAAVLLVAGGAATALSPDEYMEKLLAGDFPGKTIYTLSVQDFKKLSPEQRKEYVATSVIGPLIGVLESEAPEIPPWWLFGSAVRYPEKERPLTSRSLQILRDLTGRNCGDAVMNGRERDPKAVRRVVDWWSQWWKKNRDKHPVFDDELRSMLMQRVAAIRTTILNGLSVDYSELKYRVHPRGCLNHIEPLYYTGFDSLETGEEAGGMSAINLTDRWHETHDKEDVFLLIVAEFKTHLPAGEIADSDEDSSKKWRGRVVEVFSEEIPKTDIVITVDVGPKRSKFQRRVKESLSNLPPLQK